MNKYFLPLAAMLLTSAAVSAATVTVSYTDATYKELALQSTQNELVANEDGSFTLYNFENSGADICFKVGGKNVKTMTFIPVNGWTVATSFAAIKDADGNSARFKLTGTESKTFQYNGEEVTVDNPVYDGLCYIQGNVSQALWDREDGDYDYYTIWLRSYFAGTFKYQTVENVPATTVSTGMSYGWATFEVAVAKPQVGVTYIDAAGNEVLAESLKFVTAADDGTYTFNNFGKSGVSFSFKIAETAGADGKYALVFTDGFSSTDNADSYQTLMNAGSPAQANLTTVGGAAVTGACQVKPSGCYATLVKNGANATVYAVYIDSKFGDTSCFTVFDIDAPVKVMGKEYKFTVSEFVNNVETYACDYTWNYYENDGECIIYNFLNSGFNLPFSIKDKQQFTVSGTGEGTEKPAEYYWASLFEFEPEYMNAATANYFKLLAPDGSFAVVNFQNAAGATVTTSSGNPLYLYLNANSRLRYYDAGEGKIRKHYRFYMYAGGKYYTLAWEETVDGTLPPFAGEDTAIESVIADGNAPAEYFNIQGMRMNGDNLTPGLYIKRQGGKTTKVMINR